MTYQYLKVSHNIAEKVALIQLNRPKALNALCIGLMDELVEAFEALDNDKNCHCIVITGNERAFAAGADIRELADKSTLEMIEIDLFQKWIRLKNVKTPTIAGVSGFALGGGCELAMICDMIVASESAKFGQPEIKIGLMPGAGGTQRLTRAIGKARAMEMVLTGKFINAQEALQYGLVNRVVPKELYLSETMKLAKKVASMPPIAAQFAKESVIKAFNSSLDDGLIFERKVYHTLFSTEDQKEGMTAFIEKRKPHWKGK